MFVKKLSVLNKKLNFHCASAFFVKYELQSSFKVQGTVFDRSLVEAVQGIALSSGTFFLPFSNLKSISSSYDLEQVQTCLHIISRLTRNDTIVSNRILLQFQNFETSLNIFKESYQVTSEFRILKQVLTCQQNRIKSHQKFYTI